MTIHELPEEFYTPKMLWDFGLDFLVQNADVAKIDTYRSARVVFDLLFLIGSSENTVGDCLLKLNSLTLHFDGKWPILWYRDETSDCFNVYCMRIPSDAFFDEHRHYSLNQVKINSWYLSDVKGKPPSKKWLETIKEDFLFIDSLFSYWDSNKNDAAGIWTDDIPDFDYEADCFLNQLCTVRRSSLCDQIIALSPLKLINWAKSYEKKEDKFVKEAETLIAQRVASFRKSTLIYPDFAEMSGEEKQNYWQGIIFRHSTEIEVAKEFDSRGIFFFANPACRLTEGDDRKTREPDFVVCHNGKWGILELDGSSHNGRHSHDQQRDRLFKKNGILVVEHFDSSLPPKQIVDEFLAILSVA